MERILISILFTLFVIIMIIDINKKYIPNILNFSLIMIIIFLKFNNLEALFIGAGAYSLPMIFLYGYGSDIMKKEIIGFGDIKLMIPLGALLYATRINENINIFFQIYLFYLITFLIASLFILLLFLYNFFIKDKLSLKNRELAFSPFIILSFLLNFYFINEKGILCLNELLLMLKL